MRNELTNFEQDVFEDIKKIEGKTILEITEILPVDPNKLQEAIHSLIKKNYLLLTELNYVFTTRVDKKK